MKSLENTPSAQGVTQTQPEAFDLVMLGGGTGSTIAAWTFAGHGQRVAVIERQYLGGSCPNIACLPSKNIIHSAKVASYFRRSHEFGTWHKLLHALLSKRYQQAMKLAGFSSTHSVLGSVRLRGCVCP